jgi:DNA excision repair protein ERCC-4
MQDFQQQIFHELRKEDQLLILARGLGLLRIVANLLHAYDAAGNNLIIIIGADERENTWLGESLAEKAEVSKIKCRGFTQVDSEKVTALARQRMYAEGGLFSVTSQILIVDFLAGIVDVSKVTGIVVLHAESCTAKELEPFILRVYREKNKTGFIKAFSDVPETFTYGFSPLSAMLRNLFLRKTALYPRFQADVAQSIEGRKKAEVIEFDVTMTESMRVIQNAVMECIEASISELKKLNSGLEMDDWNMDNALHRNFYGMVRAQLEPVWHRTNFRTKQVTNDLRTLHDILQ